MNRIELEKKVIIILNQLSYNQKNISMVDVLMQLGYLDKTGYNNWRNRKVPYLEKICKTNLARLSLVNKIIRSHAHKNNMTSYVAGYMSYGNGKKVKLRFSKSGKADIEKSYATHYIHTSLKKKKKDKNMEIEEVKNIKEQEFNQLIGRENKFAIDRESTIWLNDIYDEDIPF